MKLDSLAPLLHETLHTVRGSRIPLSSTMRMDPELKFSMERSLAYGPKQKERLAAALKAIPKLRIFDGTMQHIGSSGRRTSYEDLADWLVYQSQKDGADKAVDCLARYIEGPEVPFLEVLAISGLKVEKHFEIGRGIELIPFKDLPESLEKVHFEPRRYGIPRRELLPTAALVCKSSHPKCHLRGKSPIPPEFPSRFRELLDVQLLLTLAGPSAPVWIAQWTVPESWVPALGVGGGWGSQVQEIGRVRTYKFSSKDAKHIGKLYKTFSRLPKKEQDFFKVPLGRLNKALRRETIIDSAIDLGIALESLFLSDWGPDRGELSFTLRLRAARFLASEKNARKELADNVRRLYRIRSSAVHTGSVPDEIEKGVKSKEIVELGYKLVGEVTARFILDGRPDWQDVVYG